MCTFFSIAVNVCREGGAMALTETLDCTIPMVVPRPVPPPTVTWFRDGVPAASATALGNNFDVDTDFLTTFPILTTGILNIPAFQVLDNGQLIFSSEFTNISNPMMLDLSIPTDVTNEEMINIARTMLFEILLANWTCVANSSLGLSSVQNFFRRCGKLKKV